MGIKKGDQLKVVIEPDKYLTEGTVVTADCNEFAHPLTGEPAIHLQGIKQGQGYHTSRFEKAEDVDVGSPRKPWCTECGNNVEIPCTETCGHPDNIQHLTETFHPVHPVALEPESGHDGKADLGRPPVFRGLIDYFPRACMAVAELSALGALKYEWKGWETVPDAENRYRDAIGRHQLKPALEGDYDQDWLNDYKTKVLHDVAVAWNALAVAELKLRRLEDG
jgi:hypothetical protein